MQADIFVPYMTQSEFRIKIVNAITYNELLTMYNNDLRTKIQSVDATLLQQTVFLFEVEMQPQNLYWKLWKNKNQLITFIMQMDHEIKQLKQDPERMVSTGQQVVQLHQQLQSNLNFDPQGMQVFVRYLNLLSENIYTRKTEEFLIFMEHCISVDKWGVKVYQQLIVDKAEGIGGKITGFFSNKDSNKRERDYFITITSDGILKSDNHLLESRVKSMIPFTDQLHIVCYVEGGNFSFHISACQHEKMIINLYKDYVKAINFVVAINMALRQSSYDQKHRFESYSPRRQNCASKLYNDGAGYFADLYTELMAAKWQVCITGWMITPYFLLQRPNSIENKEYRLDGVLETIAKRGVKIFIIAFMEPSMVVNNDSEHVQLHFQSLHENIKVYRHPNATLPSLWSHHEKLVVIDQEVGFMGGFDIAYGRWDTPDHLLTDPGMLWDGCDYNNYRTKDVYQPRLYKQSNLNPDFQPRMPWHDIGLQYRGDIVLDLLRHFVQYWYFVKSQISDDPMRVVSNLKKRYNKTFNETSSKMERRQMEYYQKEMKKKQSQDGFFKKISRFVNGREEKIPELLIQTRPGKKIGNQTLQMCRSASEWSIGVQGGRFECSIHNAYMDLIRNSENFIYIQNQFFMGEENRIVEFLVERITRAYQKGEKFRVIVVMPLLPGFEGDITSTESVLLRIQVHHQFQAISRGGKSLHEQLSFIPNIHDYIFYFGLRQSGILSGTPVTEIIYVHSKLMIVDDKRCIIGSANINDRSLVGNRDSQIACIIEENQGNIFDLRARIFNQHFGLSREESKNILHPNVWNKVLQNAKDATRFYREVFGCIPDDTVTTPPEVEKLASQANIMKYSERTQRVRGGHAVEFPLNFMKDEDLTIRFGSKQNIVPPEFFL